MPGYPLQHQPLAMKVFLGGGHAWQTVEGQSQYVSTRDDGGHQCKKPIGRRWPPG